MSNRQTPEWTATLSEAYGESGLKGEIGELFLCEVLRSWGWNVIHHPSSREHQMAGVDVAFRSPEWSRYYTADVKANLNDRGIFYIETGSWEWLLNPNKKSDRIWHVNVQTGWMAWYDRKEMQRYVIGQKAQNTGLLKIMPTDKIPFIRRKRYDSIITNKKEQ